MVGDFEGWGSVPLVVKHVGPNGRSVWPGGERHVVGFSTVLVLAMYAAHGLGCSPVYILLLVPSTLVVSRTTQSESNVKLRGLYDRLISGEGLEFKGVDVVSAVAEALYNKLGGSAHPRRGYACRSFSMSDMYFLALSTSLLNISTSMIPS